MTGVQTCALPISKSLCLGRVHILPYLQRCGRGGKSFHSLQRITSERSWQQLRHGIAVNFLQVAAVSYEDSSIGRVLGEQLSARATGRRTAGSFGHYGHGDEIVFPSVNALNKATRSAQHVSP